MKLLRNEISLYLHNGISKCVFTGGGFFILNGAKLDGGLLMGN